jgi:hypothetical protein
MTVNPASRLPAVLPATQSVANRASPRRAWERGCLFLFAFLLAIAAFVFLSAAPSASAADGKKVVVPFDFVSKFDNGRYGEMVGDMIWKKLEREKAFIIPDSMLSVRDICKNAETHPSPDMPLEKIKKLLEDDFSAQVAIFGSVERAPGVDGEIYDLVIKCVDFSGKEPKIVYETKSRTNSVSEIPHLYVKEMLDALDGRKPGEPRGPDPAEEKNWRENPNLIVVGDFETAARGVPKGWEAVGGQQREPLGGLVSWTTEAGNAKNHVVRFKFDANVGDNEGVMYYSDPFPVKVGEKYRFQVRWRSNGPTVKVFIKCYDDVAGEYQTDGPGKPKTKLHKGDYVPQVSQLREVYRSQQNMKGPKNTWNTHTEDFSPKHTKYTPKWGRVMLYAYLGAGAVEFDDVVVKQVGIVSGSDLPGEKKHSLETKVTDREKEENIRRSNEIKAKEALEREKKGEKK